MKWTKNLDNKIYQDALAIRRTVFIEEQLVPEEIELDGHDQEAVHFVGYLDDFPAVTARITETEPGLYHLQRVATLKEARRKGLGKELLAGLEIYLRDNDGRKIYLDSQDSAIPFYEALGYAALGEGYIKAGIPHHSMSKALTE